MSSTKLSSRTNGGLGCMWCSEGNNFGTGLVVALRPPFKRLNSSFRRGGSYRFGRRPASLVAPSDVRVQVYFTFNCAHASVTQYVRSLNIQITFS